MIEGEVSPFGEAVVPLRIPSHDGRTFEVEVTIDTGFSGFLALPKDDIAVLGLLFEQEESFNVGRGSIENFSILRATIQWLDKERNVPVLATDNGTMIGMKMLHGTRLTTNIVDGGEVEIETVDATS